MPRKNTISGSQEINPQNKIRHKGLPYFTSHVAWKGSFKARDSFGSKQVEMLVYFSNNTPLKLIEIVKKFSDNLELNFYPRSNAWPKIFNKDLPTFDDIGFYLFPQSDKQQRVKYLHLLRYLDTKHLGMKLILGGGIELLVYSSQVLQSEFRSINGDPFLWGMIFQCKKKRHKKKRNSVIREKRLAEFYIQTTPTNRSEEASPSVEKTPIAVDKGAEVCDSSVKNEAVLDFPDVPPGFGGTPAIHKTGQTSKAESNSSQQVCMPPFPVPASASIGQKDSVPVEFGMPSESSRRPEKKQNNGLDENDGSFGPMFSHVGIEHLRNLLMGSQNQSQDVGPINACSEKIGDAPETDHSEKMLDKIDASSKDIFIEQERDPISYFENQPLLENQVIGDACSPISSSPVGLPCPVISESPIARPSIRSLSQEEREESSSSAPAKSKIRGPDLPVISSDSARKHVEIGARGVLVESSQKLQEISTEQSLRSKQLDTPVISTPNFGEIRVSENKRTSSIGTSSNLGRKDAVPSQLETPVASRPNVVQVKQEPSASVRFAVRHQESSRGAITITPGPFSDWRSPFTPGSNSYHPQENIYLDYKPPVGPRCGNLQLFNPYQPRFSPVQNFRPPVGPGIGDHQYLNPYQTPPLPFVQDFRSPVGPTNGDHQFPIMYHGEFHPCAPLPCSRGYHLANANPTRKAPHFRVFSNPSFIAKETNANRSYPFPKEEPYNDRGGEGSSRRLSWVDNRGNTVISRKCDLRSPVRRRDQRRSRSPVRRRHRSRSWSPMSSSSLSPVRRRDRRWSPSRSLARRRWRSPVGRRHWRRSRSPVRHRRRSNSARNRSPVQASSRSISPQVSSSPVDSQKRGQSPSKSPAQS